MSKYTFTESNYEQAIIKLFRDQLGYEYIYGPDIERDYAEPLFLERLQQSLLAINPSLPEIAIHETSGFRMALRASIPAHAREICRRRIYATMATLKTKRRRANSLASNHWRQRAHEKHLCNHL